MPISRLLIRRRKKRRPSVRKHRGRNGLFVRKNRIPQVVLFHAQINDFIEATSSKQSKAKRTSLSSLSSNRDPIILASAEPGFAFAFPTYEILPSISLAKSPILLHHSAEHNTLPTPSSWTASSSLALAAPMPAAALGFAASQ